ncbi:hypothetical protein BOTBODRAFT_53383 [Botryobasidium botryosum FD-172 SS1]|uniref:GPI inositol-deacylase n=1 Tax=Botryobasidium botryosum (strain FD-172 SS1) TaxID=930990 RepID=A0A067MN96_BOTB1|nr:hypothetical protein BOTBODRAFT_53383 [Botryobasidium botryosum FD-172 SS1]
MAHTAQLLPFFLVIFTLVTLWTTYSVTVDNVSTLSPQACRMSWMSPSYVLQSAFDASWLARPRLARRYSLWLYREVGWDPDGKPSGTPALFIPGNAGSSHQARSIASSATRQYYVTPFHPNPEFAAHGIKQLDIFAVEFNEDFSALHGPTLDSQISYTTSAIHYILSLYPAGTRIVLLGHSMGGIVARSIIPYSIKSSGDLVSSANISAVITMSAPNAVPPARLDAHFEEIYNMLDADPYTNGPTADRQPLPPVLALCGGATDSLIPSETCALPPSPETIPSHYRRTVFTTSLRGVWTGVGHQAMVWCDQVRSRVAQAGIELGATTSPDESAKVLDKWFSDRGQEEEKRASAELDLATTEHEVLKQGERLHVLSRPSGSSYAYLLRRMASPHPSPHLTLSLARGSLDGVSSFVYRPSTLRVSTFWCKTLSGTCLPLNTKAKADVKVIPLLKSGEAWPLPEEGAKDGEGIVIWTETVEQNEDGWIAVKFEGWEEGAWLAGDFDEIRKVSVLDGKYAPFWHDVKIKLPTLGSGHSLRTEVKLPNFLAHALVAYRLEPSFSGQCSSQSTPPLLHHTTSSTFSSESHFHSLSASNSASSDKHLVLLHTHARGPFIPAAPSSENASRDGGGITFVVYASAECDVSEITLRVDWWSTLGRIGARYWATVAAWCVGVAACIFARAWWVWDSEKGSFPTPLSALTYFTTQTLPLLGSLIFGLCLLPLPASYLLGNSGEWAFAPIAPLCLALSTGLVWISWVLLEGLRRIIRVFALAANCCRRGPRERTLAVRLRDAPSADLDVNPANDRLKSIDPSNHDDKNIKKKSILSMILLLALVATVIPFQVALLISFLLLLWAWAAGNKTNLPTASTASSPRMSPTKDDARTEEVAPESVRAQQSHLVLLLFWLLPLTGSVLVVWIRTLTTAGLTAPFDGDHNIFSVLWFLLLAESQVASGRWSRCKSQWKGLVTQALLYAMAGYAFVFGSRYTYGIYTCANIVAAWLVLVREEGKLGDWIRKKG